MSREMKSNNEIRNYMRIEIRKGRKEKLGREMTSTLSENSKQ